LDRLFDLAFDERTAAWALAEDGVWTRHHLDETGAPRTDLQTKLQQQASHRPRSTRTGTRR
ncbi:hypothetical protein K3V70_14685, partial [Listeria monocytogenes]|nr:hypothetical protein [Listeria monocytogenes]